MKKPILIALIAATALMPFAASAQNWQGRGGRDRGEARADGGARGQRPQQAQQQQPQAQVQPQAAPQQSQPRQLDGGQRDRAGDRGARFSRDEAPQPSAQAVATPGNEGRRSYGDGAGVPRQYDRAGTGSRGEGGYRAQNDRRDAAPPQFRGDDRRSGGGNQRANDRAHGNDRNGGNQWAGGNERGGNWSRDWRSDRRYDWQGWRNQNRNAYRLPRYYAPRGYNYGYQRFGIGVTLGEILFSENYWIDDPWAYHLPPADGPYRWVRYYNDALLVDIRYGEVVDVIHDIFW